MTEAERKNMTDTKALIAYLQYQCLKNDLPLDVALKNMGYEKNGH